MELLQAALLVLLAGIGGIGLPCCIADVIRCHRACLASAARLAALNNQ
jgi:hypothetical protein